VGGVSGPGVSVLLPVRDAERTLRACLDSLAAQTLRDHEVIAVDDGSSDGSTGLLRQRQERDSRLRVLRTPPRGIAAALALALASARSSLIARMDADDEAHPERLARQVARLEADSEIGILGCRVEHLAEPGVPPSGGMRAHVEWTNGLLDHDAMARARFVDSPLVHPSVAARRHVLISLGGWRAFDGPEDYELWLRAFDAAVRFAKLEEVLLRWRDHPSRMSRTDPRYREERFVAVKLDALLRGPLSPGRPVVVWGAGPVGKGWARALADAGRRVAAFAEVDPRKIGNRVHGAPVLAAGDAVAVGGALHLAAVGQRGARDRIRREAARLGLREGEDLVAVA
jgi:glycosyltransferase involved in cell wall biosynthesis